MRFFTLALLALLTASGASAHDIPSDVLVHVFVKPEGHALRVLVRVPLRAIRDVQYPATAPGVMDVSRAEPTLRDAAMLWIGNELELREGRRVLPPARVSAVLPSLSYDTSFREWNTALAHVTGPRLPDTTRLVWADGLMDVLFETPIESERSDFSIDPRFGRLGVRVVTAMHFLPAGGTERAFELRGNAGLVRLDPRWWQTVRAFTGLGFRHILDGTDHLLFLFCLVLPFRRIGALVPIITAFTVAHSVTLVASAYNLAPSALWFPPLVETLIASSIVYMALENIATGNLRRRWMITFAFGLVHGFGFSFALRETLQFAGSNLLAALMSFNLGVELGQLAVLVVMVPALALLFRHVIDQRVGTVILSALVAHTAWHWMLDRYDILRQFTFTPPTMDALLLLDLVRWAMLLVGAIGATLVIVALVRARTASPDASAEPA